MDFERLGFLHKHIPQQAFRVQKLYSRGTISGSDLTMPGHHEAHSRVEDAAVLLDQAKSSLQTMRQERDALLAQLDLSGLPEPVQTAMRLRYVQGWRVERVAVEMAYCREHVYRLLRQGQKIINEGRKKDA